MRLHSLKGRGVGPFVDEISIDLDAIDGLLVALCGTNGAGKSSALALLPGAVYRTTPRHGNLRKFAIARDAFVGVELTTDRRYTIRQTIDKRTGLGESSVTDADGGAVLSTASRTAFDRWAADHLPTKDLLYSSQFGVQGSGGLIDLKPAPRKDVFIQLLGCSHLQTLSSAAGKEASSEADVLTAHVAKLDEATRQYGSVTETKVLFAEAEQQRAASTGAVEAMTRSLATLREQHRQNELAQQHNTDLAARSGIIAGALAKLVERKADLDRRLANNRKIADMKAAIENAAARSTELETLLAVLDSEIAKEAEERERLATERINHQLAAEAAERRKGDAYVRCFRLRGVTERLPVVEAAELAIPKQQEIISEHADKMSAAGAERERQRELCLNSAQKRIGALCGHLRYIVDAGREIGVNGAIDEAKRALADDDELAVAAEDAPKKEGESAIEMKRLEHLCDEGRKELEALRLRAKGRGEIERAVKELQQAERDEAIAKAETDAAAKLVSAAEGRLTELGNGDTAANAAALRLEKDDVTKLARHKESLDNALTRIDELHKSLTEATGDIATQDTAKTALPEAKPVQELRTIADAEDGLANADTELERRSKLCTEAELRHKRAVEGEAQLADMRAKRQTLEDDLADWRLFQQDLGRDGVQALIIDVAGPEVTDLSNDLLHNCLGPRFSVSIETTKLLADGKTEREGCEIMVIDNEKGREDEIQYFCGGERVVIGEAINLGVTMLNCEKAGFEKPTIIRDETGAALSPEWAPAYIAMLRRAASLIDADKVLFVSHNPLMNELADATIKLDDGKVVS